MSAPEGFAGGVASSAIARRGGLGWDQGYGIYLTTRRLVVVKVKTSQSFSWNPNGGSMLGSFGAKVTPFLDETPREVGALEQEKKAFESPLDVIASIELKKPGNWYGQGFVRFNLTSGKDQKFGLLGGYGEFSGELGSEVCDKLQTLFGSTIPEKLRLG